jgi:ParB family chromosome partitioning protein
MEDAASPTPNQERTSEIKWVSPHPLSPSDTTPRRYFDEKALHDLAEDLKTNGFLQPITVIERPTARATWMIVNGERRWRASIHNDMDAVPILRLKHVTTDEQILVRQLSENLEHQHLNPYEETTALLDLVNLHLRAHNPTWADGRDPQTATADLLKKWTYRRTPAKRAELANEIGIAIDAIDDTIDTVFKTRDGLKPHSFVNNRLPLLNLPTDVKDALEHGRLPYTSANKIGNVPDPQARKALLDKARTGASVRELNAAAQRAINEHHDTTPSPLFLPSARTRLQDEIRELLPDLQRRLPHRLADLSYNQAEQVRAGLTKIAKALKT